MSLELGFAFFLLQTSTSWFVHVPIMVYVFKPVAENDIQLLTVRGDTTAVATSKAEQSGS